MAVTMMSRPPSRLWRTGRGFRRIRRGRGGALGPGLGLAAAEIGFQRFSLTALALGSGIAHGRDLGVTGFPRQRGLRRAMLPV